jgi:outer membrane receptor protein involved in Fe transport
MGSLFKRRLRDFSLMVSVFSLSSSFAFAQSINDTDKKEEVVVVTGSRIEGAKAAGSLPVSIITQDRIEAVGSVSGDDLFRSIPQAGDVQFQEARTTGNLNDARGDNSSINLRNVGTGNTLVLLNGRRMVLTPGTQTENFVPVQTVNTNSIPVGATRRVEILRDGAAAIYGADAVAGVVNIVTDNKFEGLRATARYGVADGTDESSIAIKAGHQTESGAKFMVFGSYMHRTPLFASERSFSESENHMAALAGTDWASDTNFDNRSTSSPWGTFTALNSSLTAATVKQGTVTLTSSGVFHIEPTSNTAAGCSSTVISGNLCIKSGSNTGTVDRVLRYDENPDRTIRGGLDRTNLFSTYSQEIGNIELFGEAGYYHAVLEGQREQSAPTSSAVITIPASNYYNPFGATTSPYRLANLVGVPSTGLALKITNYRPVDTGPRTFTVTDDMIRTLFGARGSLYGFKWETAATYSWARTDDNTHNAISNSLFQKALAKSTADAYNPFNGGNQTSYSLGDTTVNDPYTIKSFLVEVHRISETSLGTLDFKFSKSDLFNLPAGAVGFAGGVEVRHETYKDDRDDRLDGTIKYTDMVTGITYGSDIMGASSAPDVKADRTVSGTFIEFSVPVVSEEMKIPLVKSIDLQLAARDEYYSDFGNVLKPKVAGTWEIFDGLKFRTSWSQSYRAPNLAQFYSTGTQVTNSRTDYAQCRINATTCSSVSTLEVRSGNQSLKAEEAETLSIGFVVQPIHNLIFTIDKWTLDEDGVIGLQGAQNQILYDYLLRLNGSSNPNVVRNAPTGTQTVGDISYVQDNYFNLGPRNLSGIDVGLMYNWKSKKYGKFDLDISASKLTKFTQSPSDLQQELIKANAAGTLGTGITITQAGSLIQQGGNPVWRASANLNWSKGKVGAGVLVNYVGEVYDTGTTLINGQYFKVEDMTTVGAYVQYRPKDARIRLGARNIFDKMPPVTSSNYGYMGSLHDAIGRFVYLEISKDF